MNKATKQHSWRIVAAEIIAATKADPDSLRSIYEDKEFRPARNASVWAQLSARLAQARKAYREAVAGGFLREVQHNMLRRCFAHDYSCPGSYMITMAVPERGSNPFGTVRGDVRQGRRGLTLAPDAAGELLHTAHNELHTAHNELHTAHNELHTDPLRLELTPLGAAILQALEGISTNYPMVKVRKAQLMPDHLHLILEVTAPIMSSNGTPRHLGHVIAGFKKGCNRVYWQHIGLVEKPFVGKPQSTDDSAGAERFSRSVKVPSNASTGRPSLWAEGYTDTIILSRKHMETEEAYLDDNIYRLRMKQLHRDLFRKVHHIRINGQDYAALGNIHLLRKPNKEQVQYHHWEGDVPAGYLPCDRSWGCCHFHSQGKPENTFTIGMPIHGKTEAEAHTERLLEAGDKGAVFVSPFISETEKAMRAAALTMGIPFIRLTREGFRDLYTPTKSEFEACCEGNLLILAPWEDRRRTATITRRECMELNKVAQAIASCELDLTLVNDNDNNETIIPRDDE